MKKIIVAFLLTTLYGTGFSQNEHLKRVPKDESVTGEEIVDHNNWSKLVPYAQKAYSEKDAAIMPLYKVKQTNYLYSESFTLINDNACDVNSLNMADIIRKRSAFEKVKVNAVTANGCNVIVELKPYDEVNNELTKIKEQAK